jgi:hypothetical protein
VEEIVNIEKFKNRAALAEDETDIDSLCVSWLRSLADDFGTEGRHANTLLTVVKDLLEIY